MIVMKEGSPVRADNTPQNSPGVATYSKSCGEHIPHIEYHTVGEEGHFLMWRQTNLAQKTFLALAEIY